MSVSVISNDDCEPGGYKVSAAEVIEHAAEETDLTGMIFFF